MEITDEPKAAICLERIGYYRLSGYWYPFRQSVFVTGKPKLTVIDNFKPGTRFQDVHDLYVFDKRLRLLFLDAIERVEVGLRVDVALLLGQISPWAHRDPNFLSGKFRSQHTRMRNGQVQTYIPHQEWLEKQDRLAARSKEDFVLAFQGKYNSALPIWMAIELWDFGLLSMFLGGMKHKDLEGIALKYGFPKRDYLTTAARAINHVRNVCAHHSRLWNRDLTDQPKMPALGEVPLLDHVAHNGAILPPINRVYCVAALLQLLLKKINPTTSWSERLRDELERFPTNNTVNTSQMGFPAGWTSLPLWQP